jgi:hypothetical protein
MSPLDGRAITLSAPSAFHFVLLALLTDQIRIPFVRVCVMALAARSSRVWRRRDAPRCAMHCGGEWASPRKRRQDRELHDQDQARVERRIEVSLGPAECFEVQ